MFSNIFITFERLEASLQLLLTVVSVFAWFRQPVMFRNTAAEANNIPLVTKQYPGPSHMDPRTARLIWGCVVSSNGVTE